MASTTWTTSASTTRNPTHTITNAITVVTFSASRGGLPPWLAERFPLCDLFNPPFYELHERCSTKKRGGVRALMVASARPAVVGVDVHGEDA